MKVLSAENKLELANTIMGLLVSQSHKYSVNNQNATNWEKIAVNIEKRYSVSNCE